MADNEVVNGVFEVNVAVNEESPPLGSGNSFSGLCLLGLFFSYGRIGRFSGPKSLRDGLF
jgi:hypothetical protein